MSNLTGLVVKEAKEAKEAKEHHNYVQAFVGKWNDPVFSSTMTAEHCVDYRVSETKNW